MVEKVKPKPSAAAEAGVVPGLRLVEFNGKKLSEETFSGTWTHGAHHKHALRKFLGDKCLWWAHVRWPLRIDSMFNDLNDKLLPACAVKKLVSGTQRPWCFVFQ